MANIVCQIFQTEINHTVEQRGCTRITTAANLYGPETSGGQQGLRLNFTAHIFDGSYISILYSVTKRKLFSILLYWCFLLNLFKKNTVFATCATCLKKTATRKTLCYLVESNIENTTNLKSSSCLKKRHLFRTSLSSILTIIYTVVRVYPCILCSMPSVVSLSPKTV